MGTGGVLAPTRYLFIDGGYLRECYARFAKAWLIGEDRNNSQLNFEKITQGYFKTFYYDCKDIKGKDEPDVDFKSRLAKQEELLDSIQAVRGCHVQLGALTGGEGKRKRQKEVDILLTVDMMNHAIRQTMTHAVLLSGDRDFRPVVRSLVELGIFVTIQGDAKDTALELRQAADDFQPMTFSDYNAWTPDEITTRYDSPRHVNAVLPENAKPLKDGKAGRYRLAMYSDAREFYACITKERRDELYHFSDFDRLIIYVEMLQGKVIWD